MGTGQRQGSYIASNHKDNALTPAPAKFNSRLIPGNNVPNVDKILYNDVSTKSHQTDISKYHDFRQLNKPGLDNNHSIKSGGPDLSSHLEINSVGYSF